MARWLTPRRFLVYSAYFVGVFSVIVGLFISKHVWNIHTTIRIIEKSWDVRGRDYRNSSWLDKAGHALFAGHEDVSEYNDLFWAKFHELDETENGPGSFNRSNLTTCEHGYVPEWADANAGYDKWGFVLYRTDYEEDDEDWAETVQHMNHTIRTHLEIEATRDGSECDPDLVRDRAVLEIIEDRETLENAEFETIRALWRQRVDGNLVDSTTKMGGWRWGGWFRLNLRQADDANYKKPNGMALNLCLVYDMGTRFMMRLSSSGFAATGPRDPWEPFLLAIDGTWDPDTYMYLTTWAHEYTGSYGVALSVLFNNFHGRTFEREMERQAPYMFKGGPLVNPRAPLWQYVFQVFLSTMHAVARPGRFPFNDRWQERDYPFVREDSFWKDPAKPESTQADQSKTTPQKSCDRKLKSLLKSNDYGYYVQCLDSDEDQSDCVQMGNYRLRRKSLSKTPQPVEEPVEEPLPTTELKEDALVEQV